jgi:hypothetical protein
MDPPQSASLAFFTMLALCITIIAAGALAIYSICNPPEEAPAPRQRARPFRAVSIVPGDSGTCCPTCDALIGRRVLLRHAPLLPVAGCEAPECTCRYRHHADRRERGPGRRLRDVGHFQPLYTGADRRRYPVARRHRIMRSTAQR